MPHQEPTLATTPNSFSDALDARYVVERELGRGGMAVVYLAADTVTGEHVALKVIHPELGAAVGGERFRQEIRIASSLSHPHILPVLDAGLFGGQLSFVMPVVTGESLHARLAREGQLPVDEAVRITREIASALDYAHARGIVHRDVKPENILLQDGHALLADFGIARASTDLRTTQTLTRTGMSIGTPAYMSPEQSTAERDVDGRSDQYSLGCVLYEMLVGQAPFVAKTAQAMIARHLMEPVPSIAVVRATVPAQVEDAVHRALAKVPADRFAGVAAFAEALGTAETWAAPRRSPARRMAGARWLTRRSAAGVLGALGLVGAGAFAVWRAQRPAVPTTPSVLLVVAPFNPLRPEFALWQEGLVDVLARNLDGAGPLETVTPAVAVRGWDGRKADRASARALAVRTKAQYAVFGSINGLAGNIVRLNASLLDVRGDSLWQGSWTGLDVKTLADSASRFVLGKLGERYSLNATRNSPLATVSFEALKLFLEGEQHFRRTAWTEATGAYTRAAALDTAFALPIRRLGQIIAWQRDEADSMRLAYALQAGTLNRGLAPRDSFLVVVDSLFAALSRREEAPTDWALLRRLFATVDVAALRYPNDPDVWYTVAEAREHLGYGNLLDVTEEEVFAAFERAIALDPGYAPAYSHAIELAFRLRGRDAGRRSARAYLALDPAGEYAEGTRLVERLTDPARAVAPETRQLLDTVSTRVMTSALFTLLRWPDSSATAMTLVHAIARRPATSPTHAADSALVRRLLPLQLAYRGRLREAYESLGNRRAQLFAEIVLLGGIETDTASAVFARWLAEGSPRARTALPFWAARGDVVMLRRFRSRADSVERATDGPARLLATHDARAARAYLQLATHDTTGAIRSFAQLSDTLCLACYMDRLTEARLLAARGRWSDADRLLRQRLYTAMTPVEVWIAAERGRVARRLDDRETAIRAYTLVVSAWSGGDLEVQPMVDSARAGLRAYGVAADRRVAIGAARRRP